LTFPYQSAITPNLKEVQLKQQTVQTKNWDENIFHVFLYFSSYFSKINLSNIYCQQFFVNFSK